ncbi:MAG: hypothetical protein ACFCUU_09130 [Cyclobacteriaceae bacterium]
MSDTKTGVQDPKPPPLQTLLYSTASAASISVVIYVIYQIFICGCH